MANLVIEKLVPRPLGTEIVERKGIGHPDSICDGVSEEISRALSKYYLDNFGRILHHNVDKALLVGGEANPEFGGGEVISPIKLIPAGRATKIVENEIVPVEEIAREASYSYLERFRNLDPSIHVDLDVYIKAGSTDLTELFSRGKEPLANDTSFGVGFWPLTDLENLVLETEKFLNSDSYHSRNPWLGEDIKVMGMRTKEGFKITVGAAFVSGKTPSLEDYLANKEKIKEDLEKLADKLGLQADFQINTADNPNKASVYITVTGLSAEAGDDGQVGRGNRANGLITPYRFMSLEAVAGKNPVNHVGKLYNIMAEQIAKEITNSIAEVESTEVIMLSQIGKPVSEPQVVNARLNLAPGTSLEKIKAKINYIVDSWLESVEEITEGLVTGKYSVF